MRERRIFSSFGMRGGAGLLAVIGIFIAGTVISQLNTATLRRDAELIQRTHYTLAGLDALVAAAQDAETGQRGFLLTGEEKYLQPYFAAVNQIHEQLNQLERHIDDPDQHARIPSLRANLDTKIAELAETIALRRARGFDAAREVVLTDRGKIAMDAIRADIAEIRNAEYALRNQRVDEMQASYRMAVITTILSGLLGVAISLAVAYLLRQAALSRRRQDWLQAGQIQLSEAMAGDPTIGLLGERILGFLSKYLGAQVGAFFVNGNGIYERVAAHGLVDDAKTIERFLPGDGLLGQAAKDRRSLAVSPAPEGYLPIASALGHGAPRHLLITPIFGETEGSAVVELGFVEPLDPAMTQLFERVSASIDAAIRSVNYRRHLQDLVEETQRQSQELQAQSEELRVNNEELEEQGHALRESQTRLENQHAELEQTNTQLEEQTQLLETQRDEAARINTTLNSQARELAQASQYKSDFLANMSHELRTPLNSSLILAKLLADNPNGNLTAEQVQYAETIQTSGNDLLTLINDILDLSKIEAGYMEIRPESLSLTRFAEDLNRIFQAVAKHKGLAFQVTIEPGCPEQCETDRQRLEQIVKNLLSNAIKFTSQGSVELTISRVAENRLGFAISDTGIGIPAEQQQMVFEAFRQADGTTNRKYGGTGLGLSISRELAKLLGGEIRLASQPGRGSTFTLTIPEDFSPELIKPPKVSGEPARFKSDGPSIVATGGARPASQPVLLQSSPQPMVSPTNANASLTAARPRGLDDDRNRLNGSGRLILVIEDDKIFARILYDLAHEKNFQCLIASTAEEGFATAVDYMPSAVVLDVGLPDHSGLWVLDRLKHDPRTRHLPVHMISGEDHSQTALALGAVGYMLKPVKREDVALTLQVLESRLSQRMGRVLVVEDDPIQLESVRKLLGSQDVQTVGAASAAECLERLRGATFDCMVLDLSLPDSTGFALLETLSREDAYSFPPVIVYTGRDLSSAEEQRLRKYSKSIIIKGAKSPERLLDEITLFLHKVISDLPLEQQRMLERAKSRDAAIEGRRILVVEDDVRNVFALTSVLESRGAVVQIARNGREALEALEMSLQTSETIDLVLMDVMMPEMDGITATREIRKQSVWKKLPIITLTAKAMKNDHEECLAAGANDYMAKPLDVEKLLSLVRVWIPR